MFSVIIPVYKVEKYLARCIDSVLAQTFTDFECILIDDGSLDNCGVICDEYAKKDERIKVIHKKNGGVSSARNAGLDVAQGEWITFVDSDDWIENNTFEIIEKYINNNSYDVICYGLKQYFEKTGKIKHIKFKKSNTFRHFADNQIYMFAIWNKFFRKNLFHGLMFNPSIASCEDLELMVNVIAKTQKICYLKDNLYTYNVNPQSATNEGMQEEIKIQYLIDTVNNISHYENLGKDFQKLINNQKWRVKFRYLGIPSIRDINISKNIYPEVNNKIFSSMLDLRKTIIALMLFLKLDTLVLFICKTVWK